MKKVNLMARLLRRSRWRRFWSTTRIVKSRDILETSILRMNWKKEQPVQKLHKFDRKRQAQVKVDGIAAVEGRHHL